ncbi:MAG: UvrD-helicase domain-containing protein, partial [Acidimicrobiales bacterium]
MPEPAADPRAPRPPDQGERDRIRSDLASTLVVEAGAGSGKTSALVGRVLALVSTGEAELAQVAAVTFTEKAAAELRHRIRSELAAFVADHRGSAGAARCQVALDQLDGAAIGTLHSFARRILEEHPIEAGLPPRFEVLDELSSGVAFEQRWSVLQEELLSEATMDRTLSLLLAGGMRPEGLRHLARQFDDNWDLVEDQVPEARREPPPAHQLLEAVLRDAGEIAAYRCSDPEDKLRKRIEEVGDHLGRLAAAGGEPGLLVALGPLGALRPAAFGVSGLGRSASWDDVGDVRRRVGKLGERLGEIRDKIMTACAHRVGSEIRRYTLAAARERRAGGRLVFHDLLVLARALLRDPGHGPEVRARLHERYRHLLLDELQDADPIQVELAARIAAAEPRS